MQRLEVSCAVRPIRGSLGVKWLMTIRREGTENIMCAACGQAPIPKKHIIYSTTKLSTLN